MSFYGEKLNCNYTVCPVDVSVLSVKGLKLSMSEEFGKKPTSEVGVL